MEHHGLQTSYSWHDISQKHVPALQGNYLVKLLILSLILPISTNISYRKNYHTVKYILRDHCHERPSVLTNHAACQAESPIFQYK